MINDTYLRMAVYLFGEKLDLDKVTHVLGVQPSEMHVLGELKSPRKKNSAKHKRNMWSLISEIYSDDFNDSAIRFLNPIIGVDIKSLSDHGLEEAYVDFFLANSVGVGELGNSISFDMSVDLVGIFSGISIPVRFSLCNIQK